MKYNLDASVFHNVCKTFYGAVVQNAQGVFVADMTGYFKYIINLTLIEVLLLLEVLSWQKDQN